jgi:hypothetical protein
MPEDLMAQVVAADILRRSQAGETSVLRHTRAKRIWLEPWFNLLGLGIGQLLLMLPWALRWRADQKIVAALGARPAESCPSFTPAVLQLIALTERLYRETGQWPAAMVFTSHPPTIGSLEWLRFEVARQGLRVANAFVEISQAGHLYRAAPECFVAIDPFALDTVATPIAALYAGFMRRVYLAWDRQSGMQSVFQRFGVLARTGYAQIAFRLIKRLKRGAPVVIVLPGGLPQNARMLYAAREFVSRLPVQTWPYPKRVAQKKWMDVVAKPVDGVLPIATGVLPDATRRDLGQLLNEWGISTVEHARWLDQFAKEFQQDVPYRTRLFRMLLERLVRRGKPLIWIAVAHRTQAPHVQIALPWGAYRSGQGDLRIIHGAEGPSEPLDDVAQVAMRFSQEFRI